MPDSNTDPRILAAEVEQLKHTGHVPEETAIASIMTNRGLWNTRKDLIPLIRAQIIKNKDRVKFRTQVNQRLDRSDVLHEYQNMTPRPKKPRTGGEQLAFL